MNNVLGVDFRNLSAIKDRLKNDRAGYIACLDGMRHRIFFKHSVPALKNAQVVLDQTCQGNDALLGVSNLFWTSIEFPQGNRYFDSGAAVLPGVGIGTLAIDAIAPAGYMMEQPTSLLCLTELHCETLEDVIVDVHDAFCSDVDMGHLHVPQVEENKPTMSHKEIDDACFNLGVKMNDAIKGNQANLFNTSVLVFCNGITISLMEQGFYPMEFNAEGSTDPNLFHQVFRRDDVVAVLTLNMESLNLLCGAYEKKIRDNTQQSQ